MLDFVQARSHEVVEIFVVPRAKEHTYRAENDGLYASNISENVKESVTGATYGNVVKVHLDADFLLHVRCFFMRANSKRTDREDVRVMHLSQIVQIDIPVLKECLRVSDTEWHYKTHLCVDLLPEQ